ncbi:MAG TPA: hypothetical protein VEZ48_03745 [Sphingomonadaceae bacterium]|nr:hypothetical protein [Sphingomonadaceae bacterium]
MFKRIPLLLLLGMIAACSGERAPPPQPAAQPQPRPVATPAPAPAPAPTPPPVGWSEQPLTPGTWTYASADTGSAASFGAAGATVFTLRCDLASRNVSLQRFGPVGGGQMSVRTSFGARSLPITPDAPFAAATMTARDPFLDNMIFSRGRFSVEVPGSGMLVLPAWAEAARVVEDCRK